MKCRIDGCDRDARYKEKQLCQKHYFRLWRNGTTELIKKEARYFDGQGYVVLIKKGHPLACKDGNIREHRFVAYEKYKNTELRCELCGKKLTWSTAHVDHKDECKQNNNPENLRILCRGCNVMRTHVKKPKYMAACNYAITFGGITLTAAEWARQEKVTVAASTIVLRLKAGWSVENALYEPSKTHPNCVKKIHPTKYRNRFEPRATGIELD